LVLSSKGKYPIHSSAEITAQLQGPFPLLISFAWTSKSKESAGHDAPQRLFPSLAQVSDRELTRHFLLCFVSQRLVLFTKQWDELEMA
jgi:hypothetical protein